MAISRTKFEFFLENIKKKWDELELFTLKDYFMKQWVSNKKFNSWAIFHTSPGFSTTNNPVESYNAVIKKIFTQNMLPCLSNFEEVLKTYEPKEFKTYCKVTLGLRTAGQNLVEDIKQKNGSLIEKMLILYL